MNPLIRFLRFNLVGLLGIAVQLATLALLNHALPHHYLLTSTLAVELTLLHNFAWHIHYTWPPTTITRRAATSALLRFHLSNGLISLLGNLILMRLFVYSFHAPILIANALAIACCGLANFLSAHHWVFNQSRKSLRVPSRSIARAIMLAAIATLVPLICSAQTSSSPATLPQAPSPHPYVPLPSASYLSNVGLLCGIGATSSSVATKPTVDCGARMTLLPLPLFFEAGIAAPPGQPQLHFWLHLARCEYPARTPHRHLSSNRVSGLQSPVRNRSRPQLWSCTRSPTSWRANRHS